MLTLGIDTATRVCSVAVCDGNKILGSLEVNVGLTHSEGLVPQLETLLKLARVKKEDLELIAVSRGPGSFTGLRIGIATAEAMAYALNLPLTAVDTLEVIAYNLPVAGVRLTPVLDAQKGTCTWAAMSGTGTIWWKPSRCRSFPARNWRPGSRRGTSRPSSWENATGFPGRKPVTG